MHRTLSLIAATVLLTSAGMLAQQRSGMPAASTENETSNPITVRGCIRSERGNYILIENKTGAVYVLQGVGTRLHGFLRKEVEVAGEPKPGSVKTGVRPEKVGSNPSDTVHGVDGVPLQVKDIQKDIRVVANRCKAADQQ